MLPHFIFHFFKWKIKLLPWVKKTIYIYIGQTCVDIVIFVRASCQSFIHNHTHPQDSGQAPASSGFHVVLGNEACDVDSMVCSLAYAYFLSKVMLGQSSWPIWEYLFGSLTLCLALFTLDGTEWDVCPASTQHPPVGAGAAFRQRLPAGTVRSVPGAPAVSGPAGPASTSQGGPFALDTGRPQCPAEVGHIIQCMRIHTHTHLRWQANTGCVPDRLLSTISCTRDGIVLQRCRISELHISIQLAYRFLNGPNNALLKVVYNWLGH